MMIYSTLLFAYFLVILLTMTVLAYGDKFCSLAGITEPQAPLILICIKFASGLIFISVTASCLNLVIPVTWHISLLYYTGGLFLFLKNRKRIFKDLPGKFCGLFLLTAAIVFAAAVIGQNNPDTRLYHIQAVKWAVEAPVPLGAANLHMRLGYNTLFFPVFAVTDHFLFLSDRPIVLLYSAWIALLIISLLFLIKEKKQNYSTLFFELIIIPIFILQKSWGTFSIDPALAIFSYTSIFLLIYRLEKAGDNVSLDLLILLFCIFTFTVKISSGPILLIPLILLFLRIKNHLKIKKFLTYGLLASAFLISLFFFKGLLLSGYPAYPCQFMGINAVWKTPSQTAAWDMGFIKAWGRAPELLYSKRLHKTAADWIPNWIKYRIQTEKTLDAMIIAALVLLIIAISSRERRKKLLILLFDPKVYLPAAVSAIYVVIWFISSPLPRYACGIITALLSVLISSTVCSSESLKHAVRICLLLFIAGSAANVFCCSKVSDLNSFLSFPPDPKHINSTGGGITTYIASSVFNFDKLTANFVNRKLIVHKINGRYLFIDPRKPHEF